MTLQKIVLTGASGSLGKVVLERLVASKKFDISILRRAGSSSKYAFDLPVIDADFTSTESLATALKGQDALIATLAPTVLDSQITLIDAAIAAGVKRFIPSDFGSDMKQAPNRSLPVFAAKVKVADYLEGKAKEGKISYTAVYNNVFLDWGFDTGFLIGKRGEQPFVIDEGTYTWSTTLLSTVGDAVVGILTHPQETVNQELRIESAQVSQQKLLTIAQELAPERDLSPRKLKLNDLIDTSNERLKNHQYDGETFVNYLYKAALHPDGKPAFQDTANKLLDLKTLSDDELRDVIKNHYLS